MAKNEKGKNPKRRKKMPAAGGFKTPVLISKAFNVDEKGSKILLETFEKVYGKMPKEFILALRTKDADNKTIVKAIKYEIASSLGVFMSDNNELVLAINGDAQVKVVTFDESDIAKLEAARQGHKIIEKNGEEVIVIDGADEEPKPARKPRKKSTAGTKSKTARKKSTVSKPAVKKAVKTAKNKRSVKEILAEEEAKKNPTTKKAPAKRTTKKKTDDGEILKR